MAIEDIMKSTETLNNKYIEEWKIQNRKVLGYYCTYIPEEIMYAGNFLGFRVRGTEASGTSKADTILSRFNCSLVRATLDLAMEGKFNFLIKTNLSPHFIGY